MVIFNQKGQEYYSYWEEFFKQWQCKKWEAIKEWTNPDDFPLYNTPDGIERSSLYIPEPWWGNDGTQPLHSVVINFNPGAGGPEQERSKFSRKHSFANDVVGDLTVLPKTRRWHKSNRAMRILNTLKRNNWIKGSFGLENHLSVELIPWHTKNVEKNYMPYLKQNIMAVYEHSICFAANESRRIQNNKLKSVVIVRTNDVRAQSVLDELEKKGISSEIVAKGPSTSGKGDYMEFKILSLPDIRFVCIWGAKSRNGFPPNVDMDEIFNKLFNNI